MALVEKGRAAQVAAVFLLGWLLAACVLATPVVSYPVANRCGWPVRVSFDVAAAQSSSPSVDFDTAIRVDGDRTMWEAGIGALFEDGQEAFFAVPGETIETDVVYFELVVDAGGSVGRQFVAELRVRRVNEEEFAFPDGPIAVEGDRCPSPRP